MEHVVQFDTNQRTSPSLDMQASSSVEIWSVRKKVCTGAAWLSSARSVRSALKWDNERNPHRMLQVSYETAPDLSGEEGGADVKSAWSLYPGLHTCYNEEDNESSKPATASQSHKPSLSGD